MSRLPQIVRNSFIRFEGLLYQFFNLFKTIFGWLYQLFGFFAKLLGFTDSQYWLETDVGQSSKSPKVEPDTPAKAPQESPPAPATSTTRRRPDSKKMEEFLKMAQQAKTSR